jgi:hypothetical protein
MQWFPSRIQSISFFLILGHHSKELTRLTRVFRLWEYYNRNKLTIKSTTRSSRQTVNLQSHMPSLTQLLLVRTCLAKLAHQPCTPLKPKLTRIAPTYPSLHKPILPSFPCSSCTCASLPNPTSPKRTFGNPDDRLAHKQHKRAGAQV